MVLKYVVSQSAFTEDFIVRVWEAADKDNPTAFVFETTLVEKNSSGVPTPGAGHQVIETVIVNGLDKFVHTVRLIGATTATIYDDHDSEPETDLLTVFSPVQFKIGDGGTNTPAADQPNAITPQLAGLDATKDFTITRNNYGVLFSGIHFDFNTSDGSWSLKNGDVFNGDPGEEFTIQILPQVVKTVVNDSVVGKWFGATIANPNMFVDITTNTNYAAYHLRKLIRFNGAFTYTFNTAPPVGYGYVFQNFGNPQLTATVAFVNAPLKWGSSTKASIDLPAFTEACFTWDGNFWNVVYLSSTTWVNGSTPQPGQIIGVGLVAIGDVPAGDPFYSVNHGLNITGDYNVWLSIKSNHQSSAFHNNKIGSTWWHDEAGNKSNLFWFSLQEISPEVQDLSVNWVIIKA